MLSSGGKFSRANEKDMESWSTEKTGFMKANGSMITGRARAWKDIAMAINMKAIFIMARLMEKEFITGLMERSMMVSGGMGSRRVMACGEESLAIVISGNGKIVRLMDMEYISGKMEIDMRAVGLIA
jgi:hypothetical protein